MRVKKGAPLAEIGGNKLPSIFRGFYLDSQPPIIVATDRTGMMSQFGTMALGTNIQGRQLQLDVTAPFPLA